MAKDIPRSTLRQMVREYKSNGLFGLASNKTINKKNTLKVYNDTSAILPAGSFVGLSGFHPTTISYEKAHSLMLGGNLVLRGVTASTSLTNAVVTKPIAAGTVGTAECEGIEFIVAHVNDSEHTEISVARETVASGGTYIIIAKSKVDSNNNIVCATQRKVVTSLTLTKKPQSVPTRATTVSCVTGITVSNNTLTYTVDNVSFVSQFVTVIKDVTLS